MKMRMPLSSIVILLIFHLIPGWAKRCLSATSLVTCMDNSQISPTYFKVVFNPDDKSVRYSLDLTTEISTQVTAHIQVFAYGFLIIEKNIDMCDIGWKQFCPVYPGSLQIDSIEYISQSYIDQIPEIAYTVPDIDAILRVIVRDTATKEQLSCIQSSFTNGKTVVQTGVKWATAVIAGSGLVIAAILSTFGNSNAASHISANAVSLFLYFQSVVIVSMQNVERVPPITSSWAENLAWSMGLIKVGFMQNIFRWYIQSTGGKPTLYFMNAKPQILVQRAVDYMKNIDYIFNNNKLIQYGKRSLDFTLNSNTNLIVLRGIKRMGYNSYIEPTSIVITGFTFFVLCGFLLAVIIILIKQLILLLIRFNMINSNKLNHFRISFSSILKGSLLKYIYIGFTQLIILSLWEFTVRDSPAVIVLAIILLIMSLSLIGFAYWQTLKFGKSSIIKYNNPAALLYGNSRILNKYGFCYTMFNAEKYWFGMVLTGYNLLKGIFIGLCQSSGKVSVLALFLLDLAYTIYLIIQAPYLNKPTNIVNYLMSIVNTLNSFFFLFFSDLFGQPAQVSSIMGWGFFVLNASFSLILLILTIVLITLSVISKNPDARFAPAKDDRASFQRKSSVKNKVLGKNKNISELLALGLAAQDHSSDWEKQMFNLKNTSSGSDLIVNQNNVFLTPSMENQESFKDGSNVNYVDFSDLVENDSNDPFESRSKDNTVRRPSIKTLFKNKELESNRSNTRLNYLHRNSPRL